MVDIKELMRTYVFINDPNVKEVTTKFGALVLVAATLAVLAWGIASVFQAPGPGTDGAPAAATADDADAYDRRECMNEAVFERVWKQNHREIVLADEYDVEIVGTGQVCVSW